MGGQGLPNAFICLPHGSGLVGVKQNQHQSGFLGEITEDLLIIISPVHLRNAVKHTGGINDGKIFQKRRVYFFQLKMGCKALAVFAKGGKRVFRIIQQGLAVSLFHHLYSFCFRHGLIIGQYGE